MLKYIDNNEKQHGSIRPGFDPKNAVYFWNESLPDDRKTNDPKKEKVSD